MDWDSKEEVMEAVKTNIYDLQFASDRLKKVLGKK